MGDLDELLKEIIEHGEKNDSHFQVTINLSILEGLIKAFHDATLRRRDSRMLLERAIDISGNEFAMGYNDSGCFWSFYAGARGAGNMIGKPTFTSESPEVAEALLEYLEFTAAQTPAADGEDSDNAN